MISVRMTWLSLAGKDTFLIYYAGTILVLDFGSQYSHLIVRRLRDLRTYVELLACTQKIAELPFRPIGIILSGGYVSVA